MDDFAGFFDDEDLYDYPDDEVPAEWDTEPEPDIVPNPHVQEAAMNEITEYEAVKAVVACIDQRGLKLDTFLDALLWGNGKCVSDLGLRDTRRQLTGSSRLPAILDHLHTPINYTGNRPQAATETMNQWAWRHVTQLSRAELDSLALDAKLNDPGSELDNIPDVENIKFEALSNQTTCQTPNLVRFLTLVGETKPRARARRRAGAFGAEAVVPSFAAVMNVHSLAFQLAPRCNKLQKHISLYFRAKRAPKSLFVLYNKCGYTTSYPWSTAAVKTLSERALLKMKEAVQNHAVFWIYDNLRLRQEKP